MALPKCTEQEFIDAFRELQSPGEVAKRFGYSGTSMVSARRKAIENRLGIVLPQFDHRPAYHRQEQAAEISESNAVYKLKIDDGQVIVGSDAHIWQGPLTTMQRAFLKFAKDLKPFAVIANGDFFDGARASRYASIGWEHRPTVRSELEAVQDYLGQLTIASGKAKRIWPLGNHDMRFSNRIAAMVPEFEGVRGMQLKDHFPHWTPCWRVDINDDVVVRHRELGGEHADFRNAQTAGKTIVTGHDHRTGVTHWVNYTGVHWGVRCGFLADSPLDPQFVNYLEAKEPNWHPAFVVLSFRKGRLLWPELVTKHDDGHVEFRGKVIAV